MSQLAEIEIGTDIGGKWLKKKIIDTQFIERRSMNWFASLKIQKIVVLEIVEKETNIMLRKG